MNQYIRQAQYKKGFANIIVIGIIIVLLLAVAGYFVFFQQGSKTDAEAEFDQIQKTLSEKLEGVGSQEAVDKIQGTLDTSLEEQKKRYEKDTKALPGAWGNRALFLAQVNGAVSTAPTHIQKKHEAVGTAASNWINQGGYPGKVGPLAEKLQTALSTGKYDEANTILDDILVIISKPPEYNFKELQMRIEKKVPLVATNASKWIMEQGGNPREIQSHVTDFESFLKSEKFPEAEAKLDQIIAIISVPPKLNLIEFRARITQKMGGTWQLFSECRAGNIDAPEGKAHMLQFRLFIVIGEFEKAEVALDKLTTFLKKQCEVATPAPTPAPTPSPALDTQAPSSPFSITFPLAGATVSGTITVSAAASDNTRSARIAGVQFQLDLQKNLGAEDTTWPYTISWDTTTVSDGNHALSAIARDKSGTIVGVANERLVIVRNVLPSTPTPATGEAQYLIFAIPIEGVYEAPKERTYSVIDKKVEDLIQRVGATGNGATRLLGFNVAVPPWVLEKGMPGKMEWVIAKAFEVAKARNVAVYFTIESHYVWDNRLDLWNWFDPGRPGYNPDNKKNVEWTDWDKTAVKARYSLQLSAKLAPHMCYNSPKILSEISRMIRTSLAPAINAGVRDLKNAGKEKLFAGLTTTSELALDNYEVISQLNPDLARAMDQDGAPKVRLGYCALTNAGYSKSNPPKDLDEAVAKINQEFGAYWAKQFVDAGVSRNLLYNHVAVAPTNPPVEKYANAPIWTAVNDYSRPGWSTYPFGPIAQNLNVLYDELAKHGNPHWGGTESSPTGFDGKTVDPATYLKWHFDHGATVLVMNSADDTSGGAVVTKGVWGARAIAAYKKFLQGL